MRTIAHIDMDAFFASVEQVFNPRYRGKPLIVCGDPDRRGVVSTASYEARQFGIRPGMPLQEARYRCPHGLYVEGDPEKYVHVSVGLLEIYKEFTPMVEPFSIDEAFLDLTGTAFEGEEARRGGMRIKKRILDQFNLTASIGIAPNKYMAKMASGLEKPNGLVQIDEEDFRKIFWPKKVEELWGVGEKTGVALRRLGMDTISDLARFPVNILRAEFGVNGEKLKDMANGRDDSPVIPYYEGLPVKSMGHEYTLSEDTDSQEQLESTLLRLSDKLGRRLRQEGYMGDTVTLKLRNGKFVTITRQRKLTAHTDEDGIIFGVARRLLRENWRGENVRLVGVCVSGLVKTGLSLPESLFKKEEKQRRVLEVIDNIRNKYGERAIVRAKAMR
jgi:nucleotidyltransferase/DNA polymerase involved in DNA repair